MSSNYPPGVTGAMIENFFAWPGHPRCPKCGAFVPLKPESSKPWEETLDCDGVPFFSQEISDEGYTACGDWGKHDPHKEIVASGWDETRTCKRCGRHWTERVY